MGTMDGGAMEPFGTEGGSTREVRERLAEEGGTELRELGVTASGSVEVCFVPLCVSPDSSFPGGVDEEGRSPGIRKV